jgi:hypothetical protein
MAICSIGCGHGRGCNMDDAVTNSIGAVNSILDTTLQMQPEGTWMDF